MSAVLRLNEQDFRWRVWEGELLIYSMSSGDTHKLPAPYGVILDCISSHSEMVVDELPIFLGCDSLDSIRKNLDDLEDLGVLVQSIED